MKGLPFRKTSDAIAAFVKQNGGSAPRRAVLCTYDLDPARFEAVVLPELTRRRSWFRTLVLADAASLQKHGVLSQRAAASSYELAPVRVNGQGVFHAKLIVLQAGAHVLIGIGSGNLTAGGLGGNLELMLFAANESDDGKKLAKSAVQFLDHLRNSLRVTLPTTAKRLLERVCLSAGAASGGPVLHNLDVPLIEQLTSGRPADVRRVIVVSPWHSNSASTDGVEPQVLTRLGRVLGAHPQVYTQGECGMAPALGKCTEVRILRPAAYGGDEYLDASDSADDARPRRPAKLHAKAYLAVGATNATLWFGSANCTMPALCRIAGQGNVELLVRASLDRKACACIAADLEAMFEHTKDSLTTGKTPRIPAPRGTVLSGSVEDWESSPRLSIELAAPAPSTRLRLKIMARRAGTIELVVPRGMTAVTLSAQQSRRLFQGKEVPPVLWEHLGTDTTIPFPVSVACVPTFDDSEAMLQDALDDLAGRAPLPLRKKARARNYDDGGLDDEERDRELELLTACAHEGALDRIAVQVELLRRRIAGNGSRNVQLYYESLIKRLPLPQELQRVLIEHLASPTPRSPP